MNKTFKIWGLALGALLLSLGTTACKQDGHEPQSNHTNPIAQPDAYADLDLSLGLSTDMENTGAILGKEAPKDEARTNITLSKQTTKFTAEFDGDANTHTNTAGMLKAVVAIKKSSDNTLFLTQVDVKKEKEGNKSFRIQSSSTPLYKVSGSNGTASSTLEGAENTQYQVKVFLGAALKDNKTIAYGVAAGDLQTAPTAIQPIFTMSDTGSVEFKNAYGNVPFVNADWKALTLRPSTRPDRNKKLTLRMEEGDNLKLKPQGTMMVLALRNSSNYAHTISEMGFYSSALTQRGHYVYNGNGDFGYKPLTASGSETMSNESDWLNFKFTSQQMQAAGLGDKGFTQGKTCYVYFWAMSPQTGAISTSATTQALFKTTRYDTGDRHEREYTYPAFVSIGRLRGLKDGQVITSKADIAVSGNNVYRPHPMELIASTWTWNMGNDKTHFRFRRGEVGSSYLQSSQQLANINERQSNGKNWDHEGQLVLWSRSEIVQAYDAGTNGGMQEVACFPMNDKTGEYANGVNTSDASQAKKDNYFLATASILYGVFPAFDDTTDTYESGTNKERMKKPIGQMFKTKEKIKVFRADGQAEDKTYVSYYIKNNERRIYALRFLEEIDGDQVRPTPYTSAFRYEWQNSWTGRGENQTGPFTPNIDNNNKSRLQIRARKLGGMNEYSSGSAYSIAKSKDNLAVDGIKMTTLMTKINESSWWDNHPMADFDMYRTYPVLGYESNGNGTRWSAGKEMLIHSMEAKAGTSNKWGKVQNMDWKAIRIVNFTEEQNDQFLQTKAGDDVRAVTLLMRVAN